MHFLSGIDFLCHAKCDDSSILENKQYYSYYSKIEYINSTTLLYT